MSKLEDQGDDQDSSYEMAWMGLWSWIEIALGTCTIVACTVTLPKLVRAELKKFGALWSSVARPFTSFIPIFRTNLTKTRSNEITKEKALLQELDAKAPRV
jgi:hypothetical protein